jgi:hypothetical protein
MVHLHHRTVGRTVASAAVLLLLLTGASVEASAAGIVKATTVGRSSVTSATWKATVTPGSFTFTGLAAQTATVANIGTVGLSSITYQVTVPSIVGAPTFTLFVCAVPWVSGRCSGGSGTQVGGTIQKDATTTMTSTVVPAVGGDVYLELVPSRIGASVTVSVSTSITSPVQLRAAVVTRQ